MLTQPIIYNAIGAPSLTDVDERYADESGQGEAFPVGREEK
jgi:hypothetical protein